MGKYLESVLGMTLKKLYSDAKEHAVGRTSSDIDNLMGPLPPAPPCETCYLGSKLDVFGIQNPGFWDHLGSKLGSLRLKLKCPEAILAPSG
eukprot:8132557-Karenia_brevis.AAC.1